MSQLSGSLEAFELRRILDFFAELHHAGSLRIEDGGRVGEIDVLEGRVISASIGSLRGLAALEAIVLTLPRGRFSFTAGSSSTQLEILMGKAEMDEYLARLGAERDELARDVPSLSVQPRVAPEHAANGVHESSFDIATVRTLLSLDGRRSVEDLAADRGPLETLRQIAALKKAGLVSFEAPAPSSGAASTDAGDRPGTECAAQQGNERGRGAAGSPDANHAHDVFALLGKFAFHRRWLILLAGLIFVIGSAAYGIGVFGNLKTGSFVDPASESVRADDIILDQFGRDDDTLVVLFTATDDLTVDSPEFRADVESILAGVGDIPGTGEISSFYSTGAPQLVSSDRRSTFAAIDLLGEEATPGSVVKAVRPLLASERLQVQLGGEPAVNDELTKQVKHDLETAEKTTFPILAVLLVLIFGSLVASALPLAIGVTAIAGALLLVRLVTQFTDVSVFALNVITMLGLGLAIDYSLFVVSRFREQLAQRDGDVQSALVETMRTAGRTVFFSGLTVIVSLLSLLVFAPVYLKSMGIGAALSVVVGMLAALTILPAALAALGSRVDALSVPWLRRKSASTPTSGSGFWQRTSTMVMRHPGLVIAITVIPLLWLGLPFLRVNLALPDARALPASHQSRQVADALTTQFPGNEAQPIKVVVRTSRPALEPDSLNALYDYTRELAVLPGVRQINSLVNLDPSLGKPEYTAFYSAANTARDPRVARAADRYARGNYSIVTVLYDGDPYAIHNQDLVRAIRETPTPAGFRVQVSGDPAHLVDLLESLRRSAPLAIGVIVTVMFALLFMMLGSLVVPLKAVILNALSLSVSFGALVWIFQDGNLSQWLGFTPLGSIDAMQPVLIFALAFGLSMDYEVFLLSRIKEHYDRTGDMNAAVGQGIQRTGGIITGAALLMVVVIGGFVSGEVVFVKQIGIGLALAILIDATIVRMLLVPATMRMLGAYNWWAPGPLEALYRRIGLGDVEAPPETETGTETGTGTAVKEAAAPRRRVEPVPAT